MNSDATAAGVPPLSAAEIGAIAHLYRGEMYRSKIWRSRLDTTTNWAVVTTGIAISAAFSSTDASPLPLVLVGLLLMVFLIFEARRYRYFDVWRVRVRVMEAWFFGPMLRCEGVRLDNGWNTTLADDYRGLHFHISFAEALGRRLRRNYSWILAIQAISYYGKLAIHPTPLVSLADLWTRAAIGPIPGELVVLAGVAFHGAWLAFAFLTLRHQRAAGRFHRPVDAGDRIRDLASGRT
jgi:uncharacterized membrane protein